VGISETIDSDYLSKGFFEADIKSVVPNVRRRCFNIPLEDD
jgi:hypothetical protein